MCGRVDNRTVPDEHAVRRDHLRKNTVSERRGIDSVRGRDAESLDVFRNLPVTTHEVIVLSAARVIPGVREDGEHLPRRLVTSDSHILEAGRLAGCGEIVRLGHPSIHGMRDQRLRASLAVRWRAAGHRGGARDAPHAGPARRHASDAPSTGTRSLSPTRLRGEAPRRHLGQTEHEPGAGGERWPRDRRRSITAAGSTPMTEAAPAAAARRIATPGPHPMSTTRSPAPTEANRTARSASGCRPTVKLRAAIRPPKPPNPG